MPAEPRPSKFSVPTRRSFLALGALGGLVTLTACEGGILKKTVYTQEPTTLPAVTETTTQTIKPAVPQTPGVAADKLNVATALPLAGGLDPVLNSDPLAVMVSWHVFEGLYTIDRTTGAPRNGLGVGEPQQTGDNEYTVTLRNDITFHDGSPLAAEDPDWNLSRMKNSGPPEIRALLQPITRFSLRDKTIVVRTTGPIRNLKERLSFVPFAPRLSQIANPEKFNLQQPVGTGPWKVFDASKPGLVELRPHSAYTGELPAGYASMRVNLVPLEADRVKQLEAGTILATDVLSAASGAAIAKAGRKVVATEATSPILMGFNCADPALTNPAVRSGLYTAAGASALAAGTFKGNVVAAKGFFAEKHPAFAAAPVASGSAAGVGAVKILTSNDELISAVTKSIVAAFQSAGVAAEVETVAAAELIKRVRAKTFQIVIYEDDPARYSSDADTMLRWFYDAGAANFGWAEAPERTGVLQAIDAADYAKAAQLAASACPVYPLLHRINIVGFEPALVAGVGTIGTAGLDMLNSKTLPAPAG